MDPRLDRKPPGVARALETPLAADRVATPPTPPGGALLVRGGGVLWRGHAILVPGGAGQGTSRLVAALVRAGADPIVDGQVWIEGSGRVHHQTVEGGGADLALIVATTYRPAARWQPVELHGARAVLSVLDRAAAGSGALRRQVHVAAQLARRVTTLSGPRPEADQVAPAILAYLDELIDGRRPAGGAAQAATAIAARAAEPTFGAAPPEVERELLLRQPSLVMLFWHGRFGNRMHQYAYGATYARRTGCRLWLPSQWEGTQLFAEQPHAVLPHGRLRATLNRSRDQFDRPERRLGALREVVPEAMVIRPTDPRSNYTRRDATACFDDMCAYHPSIFAGMSRAHLRWLFAFSDTVKRLDLYKRLEDRQGTYDIAHLRRDDISDPRYNQTHVQAYSVLSKRSYEAAFAKFGCDPAAVEWVSDDYTGKWHAGRVVKPRGTWRYPVGSEVLSDVLFDWLEDFLRLYFARVIFRANSSFSWWAAFLSPGARVFSPVVDRRHVYGVDGLEELDVVFVEGNHPHWMSGNADIRMGA